MSELINEHKAVIKVIGVGGGGGNAIVDMAAEIQDVDFWVANTDAMALAKSTIKNKLQLGDELTKGLGAGADPEIGRQATEESKDQIYDIVKGTDLLFLAAGMGGGTGTGATPVFAEVAKELGILTVAVVTKPFSFEGSKRMQHAATGIELLSKNVDSLIIVPNNKLLSVLGKSVSLVSAFRSANMVLKGAVQGISDLITRPGLINVDFADVKTVMTEMGMAMMGSGSAKGDMRAREAAEAALSSPLLEDIDLSGAKGVLVNISGGLDMTIGEFESVGDTIRHFTTDSATVVVGTVVDPELNDELKVTVVVTGLESQTGSRRLFSQRSALGRADRPSFNRTVPQPILDSEEQIETDVLDVPAFLRQEEES
ncbi:MAG: cell division protein FtsZ [Legionellales bacterium]|nr:cell division protein FtsZ [Legionellales bacterium]OUX66895.1 MAG: cell division protein FtsZ [bacterium TMED178]|tara:strand:- start:4078 stop:5187 length:1110 start_codon:yes stop_codon:yes gene_type:complete